MAIFTFPNPKVLAAFSMMLLFCMCRKNTGSTSTPANDIIETKPATLVRISDVHINEAFNGYYISLPEHYAETTKKYPVIFYLHGLGQMGNGSSELDLIINDGIGKVLKQQRMPPNFKVGKNNYSFIIISPQSSRQPYTYEVAELIGYMKKTYRLDDKRMYLSGLSLGARVVTLMGARYPDAIAAIAPMAGVAISDGMAERCETIAKNNLPVWEFHNLDDPLADVEDARRFISLINGFNPTPLAKMSVFNVYGHDAWTVPLDPEYRENGLSVYEWMLQYSR